MTHPSPGFGILLHPRHSHASMEAELPDAESGEEEPGEESEGEDEAALDVRAWLPALAARPELAPLRFRTSDALAELELSRLARMRLSEADAGEAGAEADGSERHVVVAHGPGRLVHYVDASAPTALLCDLGGLPPCAWVPLGALDTRETARELERLCAAYPLAARDAAHSELWDARPPATTSPDPSALLPRLLLSAVGGTDSPGLAEAFGALLGTRLLVSTDTVAEVREAAGGATHTELIEVELRGVHSGCAVWLHAHRGLLALSAEAARALGDGGGGGAGPAASAGAASEGVLDGINGEFGTGFAAGMPLDAVAALLRAECSCVRADDVRSALRAAPSALAPAPPAAGPARQGGGSTLGAAMGSVVGSACADEPAADEWEAGAALHVLWLLRAPSTLQDAAAAARHPSARVRLAAATVSGQAALDGELGFVEVLERIVADGDTFVTPVAAADAEGAVHAEAIAVAAEAMARVRGTPLQPAGTARAQERTAARPDNGSTYAAGSGTAGAGVAASAALSKAQKRRQREKRKRQQQN